MIYLSFMLSTQLVQTHGHTCLTWIGRGLCYHDLIDQLLRLTERRARSGREALKRPFRAGLDDKVIELVREASIDVPVVLHRISRSEPHP